MTSWSIEGRPPERDVASRPISASTASSRALGGVHVPLRRDAHGWLDLEAGRAAHADDLGAEMHRDPSRPGLDPALGGAEAAEPGERVSMQLTASLDQRSPQRLVVTFAPATALSSSAIRRARSVSRPSCSPP